MSNSVKRLVNSAIALIFILSVSFLILILFSNIQSDFKSLIIVFIVSLMTVCIVFYWLMSKQVNIILEGLSETIQNMINDSPMNTFSELDDMMLSKIQYQIMKLSDILKSQSKKEKLEKEKITALISDISHQLRTPLSNLNMYNNLLFDNSLSEVKKNEFLKNMQSQIEKLNWLMEALIKMSRLETGLIDLKCQRIPILQTLLQAVNMVAPKAEKKSIDITFKGDESIRVNHDTKWTQEAMFNILDNAVKYSPENTVISLFLEKYELFCRIDISDEGSGIAEPDINKIFTRFYRGDNTNYIEGVGIGLFLSREIIAEQGGYIKVKSNLGKGSTFSVFLPVE